MDQLTNRIRNLDLSIGIGEASRITGASSAQLRYWEKKGLIDTIQHQNGGNKRYNLKNLMKIIAIKYYIDNGYTLAKASDVIKSHCDVSSAIRTFIFNRLIDIQNEDKTVKLNFGKFDNDDNCYLIVKITGKNVSILKQKEKEL